MITNNLFKHEDKIDKEFRNVREEIRKFFKAGLPDNKTVVGGGSIGTDGNPPSTKVTTTGDQQIIIGDSFSGLAEDVIYVNGSYNNVKEVLDALLYINPSISSFSCSPSVSEVGSTVTTVTISWAFNKSMASSSISEIGDVQGLSSKVLSPIALTANKSWTLTASDGTNTVTSSTGLVFRHKRYWGVSANESLSDADILALSKEFATGESQSRTFDCSGGKYFYIAYPASWGSITAKVGGLSYTDWTLVTRAFINSSGYSESYNIYRSGNIQTGSAILVEVTS